MQKKKDDCDRHLEQLTQWLESKQTSFGGLLQSIDENDSGLVEARLVEIQVNHPINSRETSTCSFCLLQIEHDTMREGYQLLRSIEVFHKQLQPIHTDEDNRDFTELLQQYHQQLESCDASFMETIGALRRMQMNLTKFDDSCQDIEHSIEQQRTLFEQFIDNNPNLSPENLPQQIQILQTLQREIETKTNSLIETARQTTSSSTNTETKLRYLRDENEQLKEEMLV